MNTILCNLKTILKNKNVQQKKLAKDLNYSEQLVSHKLNGSRGINLNEFKDFIIALDIGDMTLNELFIKELQ
jgi:transcriptional regulator with XRE-family HTH domain